MSKKQDPSSGGRLKSHNLDFQWPVVPPFLFCVHHDDRFPKGNGKLGVETRHLSGRDVGQDFVMKDGFRMYHGNDVPGFPVHPHRGFETITIVRRGYVDHADSIGAAGRYGEGDVQWMTAGAGVQHSEMFPLINTRDDNHVELFQIWLNLSARNKMVAPHFKMFWSENIPRVRREGVEITVIAGEWDGTKALMPPPDSWASDPKGEVAIFLIRMDPGAKLELKGVSDGVRRMLYFFEGDEIVVSGDQVRSRTGVEIMTSSPVAIQAAGGKPSELLLLQGAPMPEPQVQYGPFVMNTQQEILQAMEDYRRTQFGGWPWPRSDMVHGDKPERFALYPDGRRETPHS